VGAGGGGEANAIDGVVVGACICGSRQGVEEGVAVAVHDATGWVA